MKLRITTAILATLCGGTICLGQGPAPGFRVFGGANTATQMVDVNGNVVHTWPNQLGPSGGRGTQVLPDGSLLRAENTTTRTLPFMWAKGRIQRIGLDGTILWDFEASGPDYIQHHDLIAMPNGNVMMIAYEEYSAAQAQTFGRDPSSVSRDLFRPEKLMEVQPTGPMSGMVVWEWKTVDHVIQDRDPNLPNYGNVAAHPELIDIHYPLTISFDFSHANGIDYDPVHDVVVLSLARTGEIWVIDHSTTTAEARGPTGGRWGKGGDLLYRWGNLEAYRKGTANDRILFRQHDPRFVPPGFPGAGNITILNNQAGNTTSSAVIEIVPPRDAQGGFILDSSGRYGPVAPIWTYSASGFYTSDQGGAQRLRNGNTLIASGQQARVFEVTPSGQVVWNKQENSQTYGAIFLPLYVPETLFADARTVSASNGVQVKLDLIAGSEHSAQNYLMLLSSTGTTPGITLGSFVLPLNFDGLTEISILSANAGPFLNTLGNLDTSGRATATFALPPLSLAGTLTLHWAYVAWDQSWTWTSNAVPLSIDR